MLQPKKPVVKTTTKRVEFKKTKFDKDIEKTNKGLASGVRAKAGKSIKKAQTGYTVKPYEKSVKTSKEVGVKGNDLLRVDSAGKIIEKAITPQQKIALRSKQTKDSTSTMNSRNRMLESAKRFGRGMKTGGSMKKCKYGCK